MSKKTFYTAIKAVLDDKTASQQKKDEARKDFEKINWAFAEWDNLIGYPGNSQPLNEFTFVKGQGLTQ